MVEFTAIEVALMVMVPAFAVIGFLVGASQALAMERWARRRWDKRTRRDGDS